MEARPRVLVGITYGFSVRYFVSTGLLERLANDFEPVVGIGWDDPELVALLASMGIESHRLPDARLDHEFRMYRRRLDMIHERRLASPSTRLERKQRKALTVDRRERLIMEARRGLDTLRLAVPGAATRVEASERQRADAGTNIADFEALLDSIGVEGVVSATPYHEQDTLLLLAARSVGLRTAVAVISFDNPTTRRRIPAVGDRLLVWNDKNRAELLRSYRWLEPSRVGVVGAPQFDLHHRTDLVMDESDWRSLLGIPEGRRVILYGGGPAYLVPGETALVELLDEAIESNAVEGDPFLLARRHPADDPAPWDRLARRLRNGVVSEPWTPGGTPDRGWPDDDDLRLLMSSLAHSAVHVNVCSSMTLDGAVFDRPQIGPRFVPGTDDAAQRRVRDLYEREHWWPITRSGGLVTADDPTELIAALNESLADPSRLAVQRRRMVEDLLTWDDGRACERLADEVSRVFSVEVSR